MDYTVTLTPKSYVEPITETTGFADWYDSTDPDKRLGIALKEGVIECQAGDDDYFLETVLDEARRLNHGYTWIKEIMETERKSGNIHYDISADAVESQAFLEDVIDAYKLHISILDYGLGNKNQTPISESTIKQLDELISEVLKEEEE